MGRRPANRDDEGFSAIHLDEDYHVRDCSAWAKAYVEEFERELARLERERKATIERASGGPVGQR